MKYDFHFIPVLIITALTMWIASSWANDSTGVPSLQTQATAMIFAPSVTPNTVIVPINANNNAIGAPNDAVCPSGYTLTSLKYTSDANNDDFAYDTFLQTSGACTGTTTNTTTSDQTVYGGYSTNPSCPAGTTAINSPYCDSGCNYDYGGPAGGYCGGAWGNRCMAMTCRTTTTTVSCSSFGPQWVSSSNILPQGANNSPTYAIGLKEAICTDFTPNWHTTPAPAAPVQ